MPKVRESGVPECAVWESFFDAERALDALLCCEIKGDALEFGCGYGTFSVPAALRVSGTMHALDIDPSMIAATQKRALQKGLTNLRTEQRDFVAAGSGLPPQSMRYVMLFNILHLENPMGLLHEARRVLQPGGCLAIMHWRRDIATPRGPSLDIRPSPTECRHWAERVGLRFVDAPELPGTPWHWGMCMSV